MLLAEILRIFLSVYFKNKYLLQVITVECIAIKPTKFRSNKRVMLSVRVLFKLEE